jgi:hypothetical protein
VCNCCRRIEKWRVRRRISRLEVLEADVQYQETASEKEPEFRYIQGAIPVLLSAPHGAVHTRPDGVKEEDEFTAGFAQLVAERTDAHVLYARRKSSTDPNWYADVPYKGCLEEIVHDSKIKFVLDIHGAKKESNFGIALGTLKGKSCPGQRDVIIEALERWNFFEAPDDLDRIDVDNKFTAMGKLEQETVTKFVWTNIGIPVCQIEVNAHLRIPKRRSDATNKEPFEGDVEMIKRAINALVDVVMVVSGEQ